LFKLKSLWSRMASLQGLKVKNIDTKESNKMYNQNSKDKRQDYNMK